VVGVDVTVADLVEDVTYFRRGELSYAFIIDETGTMLAMSWLIGNVVYKYSFICCVKIDANETWLQGSDESNVTILFVLSL
jgi:hypothetical protein